MVAQDTQNRLLEAAERLFSEHGFSGTSLRAILDLAGVANMAAIHYHFGSKERVFEAVIERRINALTADRLARLDALAASDEPGSVESITRALLGPLIEASAADGANWLRLLARSRIERGEHWDTAGVLARAMFDRFIGAYHDIYPDIDRREVAIAIYVVAGAMLNAILDTQSLEGVGYGLESLKDNQHELNEWCFRFFVAGLQATLENDHSLTNQVLKEQRA